jgi:putative Mg2+ transporter-C (MgtC) family protein
VPPLLEPIGRLVVAAALGAILGAEREYRQKAAGLRTNTLISLGSALFTLMSIELVPGGSGDPSRVAAQIVTGIGFLGGGAILRTGMSVRGLTTAATIWVVAAVGVAAGAGKYGLAVATTAIAFAVLTALPPLEELIERDESDKK